MSALTAPTPYPLPAATMLYADAMAALARVAPAVPARPPVPVLGGVMFDVDDTGHAAFSAFDYRLGVRAPVDVKPSTDPAPGRVLIPYRRLVKVLKAIARAGKTSPLTLDCRRPGWAVANVGEWAFPIEVFPIEEYPPIPHLDAASDPEAMVLGATIKAALGFVRPAASRDLSLPLLVSVRIAPDGAGRLTLTATDRYRIHEVRVACDGRPNPGGWTVPTAVIDALTGNLTAGPWAIKQTADWLTVQDDAGTTVVATDLADGNYPKTSALWPVLDRRLVVTVQRLDLLDALAVADDVRTSKGPMLMSVFGGPNPELTIVPDYGSEDTTGRPGWSEQFRAPRLPAVLDGPWPDSGCASVAFDPYFGREAIAQFTGREIALSLNAVATKPLMLADSAGSFADPVNRRALLMPVRMRG